VVGGHKVATPYAAVRKHRTVRQFQIFAEKGLSALICNKISKALDDEFVPWGKFREDIVQCVSDAKGKTKSGAARGSVMHMNTKVELKKRFGNYKIEEFHTVDRKDAWRRGT
jgi:nitrogenase subunit NifH